MSNKSNDVMSRDLRLIPYWSPPRDSKNSFFFFFKVFGGHMSFFGATATPVLDFW